eukprot:CAMPEP_0171233300 /NCGR_PEP_ID=MMETSP0790-20130122/40848_1 /TAXON_ID=2925 /ORGANISM="Alexandrium catenella, Strain OF101" /LENGTH=591 /DNA_ID=CAMNT_0011699553 /DNA_START=103 /DNA_END=1878 /DNA_ORIENTATION=-
MKWWPALLIALQVTEAVSDAPTEAQCDQGETCSAPTVTRGSSLLQSRQVVGKSAVEDELEMEEADTREMEELLALSLGRELPAIGAALETGTFGSSSAVFPCPSACQWCSPSASSGQVVISKNIQYGQAVSWATGKNENLLLDTYKVPSAATKPVMVVIHGGSYSVTSTKDGGWAPHVATLLARHGFLAASIEYRRYGEHCKKSGAKCGAKTPNPKHAHPVHDALAAVRYIRKNAAALKADPNRIAFFGCSAGGTTVAHAMLHNWGEGSSGNAGYSSAVQAGIALSGTSRSTYQRKTSGVAPYLAFHNQVDNYVPYGDAVQTRDYLNSIGSPNELITLPGTDHCPDIFKGGGGKMQDFMGFLTKYLILPGSTCPSSGGSSPSPPPPAPVPAPPPAPVPAPPPAPSLSCPSTCSAPSCNGYADSGDAWLGSTCVKYCSPYQGSLWCTQANYGTATDCTACAAAASPAPTPAPAPPPSPPATAPPTPAPTPAPTPPPPPAPTPPPPTGGTFVGVDGGSNRVCRGAHQYDNSASHYSVHYFASDVLNKCKDLCVATAGCGGVEVKVGGMRCEVWTRPVQASKPKSGFACYSYGP